MSFQIPLQPMLGRRQLRLAVLGALNSASLAVNGVPVTIMSPGDWTVIPEELPAIIVRTANESKTSFNKGGAPRFVTTCVLEVKAIVEESTAEAAQDSIEALWYAVENAILQNYSVIAMLDQVAGIDSGLEISAEGSRHLAGIAGAFRCEFPETAYDITQDEPEATQWPNDPPPPAPLDAVSVVADLTNVFDATGTYTDPSFPQAVTPAPRTQGPDGRAEGTINEEFEP